MTNEIILLLHPTFGALAMLAAVWVFVEALNASAPGVERMRTAAKISAVLMWLSYLLAAYFYVALYGPDKAVIKEGPWRLPTTLSRKPKSMFS